MTVEDSTDKKKLINFFGIYFTIHLKTNRRKIILSIINSILLYLIIISTFTIWSINKGQDFNTYFTSKENWKEDGVFSAYFSTEQFNLIEEFAQTSLDTTIIDIQNELSNEIQNIIFTQTTGLISIEFFQNNGSSYNSYGLNSLNNETSFLLNNCLIAGRLPENSTEILYHSDEESVTSFNTSDIITLQASPVFESMKKNLTIVGIIGNLDSNLSKENYSVDILDWQKNIARSSSKFTPDENFFSLPDIFFNLLNSFDTRSCSGAVLIDFQYNLTLVDSNKINTFISNTETLAKGITLKTGETFYVGLDVLRELISYRTHWIQETFMILILQIPILFLLGFFFFEIFHSFKSTIQTNFRQVLVQGVSKKDIQKLIFMEAILIQIISLVVGIILGILSSFLLSRIFFKMNNFRKVLLQAFITLPIAIVLFFGFLIFLIILNNKMLKDVPLLKSKRMKVGQNKQTRIISMKEISVLVIGLTPFCIGLLISIVMPSMPPISGNAELTAYSSYVWYWLISQSFMYFGGIVFAVGLLSVISKIFTSFYSYLGKRLWEKWKNQITLSLLSFSFNKKHFRKILFTLLIIGFGILPGFIIKPSVTKHIDLEANLASGGSDLIIYGWEKNKELQHSIENIDGVINSTEVNLYKIESEFYNEKDQLISFNFHLLTIFEPTSFVTIVDFERFDDTNYYSEEINLLQSNLTCMIDENYAKKNKLAQGEILHNRQLCEAKDIFQLKYITSFIYFPLLPQFDLTDQSLKPDALFVMNGDTTNTFLINAKNLTITSHSYLLIDLEDNVDIISIINSIEEDSNLSVKTDEMIKTELLKNINEFIFDVFIIWCLLISCYLILYMVLKAGVIFKERKPILENEYRLGKSKLNMSISFLIEISFYSIIPIILTIILNTSTLRLVCINLLNTPQLYKIFKLNLPFWLLLSLFILLVGITVQGWSIEMIRQIRRFRMIKQE